MAKPRLSVPLAGYQPTPDTSLVAALPGYPGRPFPSPVPPGRSALPRCFQPGLWEALNRCSLPRPLQVCAQPLALRPLPVEGASPHHLSRSVGRLRDWSECKLHHAPRLVNPPQKHPKPLRRNVFREFGEIFVGPLVLCDHGCYTGNLVFAERSQNMLWVATARANMGPRGRTCRKESANSRARG